MDTSEVNFAPQSSLSAFFNHVFVSSPEHNAEVFNTFQYVVLSIIPIIILNKTIATYIPAADDYKGSIEIIFEIIAQLLIMFGGITIVHRMITYVPTYSGYKYEPFVLTNSILIFMIILFSIQSKMSSKINILYSRLLEQWNGPDIEDQSHSSAKPAYSSQPLSNPISGGGGGVTQLSTPVKNAIDKYTPTLAPQMATLNFK